MKKKLLFITGPNKILRTKLYIVFQYVDFYSILVNFHTDKMTNWDQMNISNDLKTFMRESIHDLGMLQTHNTCVLISSSPSRRTKIRQGSRTSEQAGASCLALDQGPFRLTNQSMITTSVMQAWT